jgi:ankyrin repeat protein
VTVASVGDLERVRALLSRDAGLVHARRPDDGSTALLEASYTGHKDVVEHLLDRGADPAACDWQGRDPLFLACSQGRTSIVNVLLRRGARPQEVTFHDAPWTCLTSAAANGHVEVARALLKYHLQGAGAGVDIARELATALYEASFEGHGEMVSVLLEKGADPDMPTWNEETPLEAVRRWGRTELVLEMEEVCSKSSIILCLGDEAMLGISPFLRDSVSCGTCRHVVGADRR